MSNNELVNLEDFYFDSPVSGTEAEELLSAARLALLYKFPFFGKIACSFSFVETDVLPTMAVDQKGHLFYNRNFVNSFDSTDAIWSVAHEVMHPVQRFWARKPTGALHYLWNLAADYCLEVQLKDTGLEQSKLSKLQITPDVEAMVRRLETVPAVYQYLLEQAEDNTECEACKEIIRKLRQQGKQEQIEQQEENEKINNNKSLTEEKKGVEGNCSGCEKCNCKKEELKHTCGLDGLNCCSGSLVDGEMDSADEQKWLQRIVAAKQYAESRGTMPAALSEQISQLTKSKVRWQDYIKVATTRLFGRDRYTFKRINRRGPAIRMRLPGHVPDSRTAVCGVDTSGSMSTEEVRQCLSEVQAIIGACGCGKLWLILHDYEVYFSGWISEADLTKLKMARGGTSHEEVFSCLSGEHSAKEFNIPNGEHITLAILFTDLGTCFPPDKPSFEVIWGVPSKGNPGMSAKVPFGKKIEVETDQA